MQYKSILSAFVASSLVAAAPVPGNADAAPTLDTFATSPELATLFEPLLPLNTSLLVAPRDDQPFVPFPKYQSTNEGHTWPLVDCDPLNTEPMLEGFSCTPGLLKPYGSNTSIITWDTDVIKIGNPCNNERDNPKLPLTWVCMKPNGSNNNSFKGSHLQRGFWIDIDCRFHDRWTCPWAWKRHTKEVVDEKGFHWDQFPEGW